jgi:putative flippase GtrA
MDCDISELDVKGAEMAQWHERLNGYLGRLVFRFFGVLCGMVALMCGYAAWWHVEHWDPDVSLVPTILFSIAAIAAASCIPYCFSRKRSFVEALDAMEGGVGDQHRRP